MFKYVLFWMSYFDNIPHLEEAYASDYADALVIAITNLGVTYYDGLSDMSPDELKAMAFNSDASIEALRIYGD